MKEIIANFTLSPFHSHRVKPGQLSFAPWPAYKIMVDVPRGNWQYADSLPWTDGACASTNAPYIKLLQDYGPIYPVIELYEHALILLLNFLFFLFFLFFFSFLFRVLYP